MTTPPITPEAKSSCETCGPHHPGRVPKIGSFPEYEDCPTCKPSCLTQRAFEEARKKNPNFEGGVYVNCPCPRCSSARY